MTSLWQHNSLCVDLNKYLSHCFLLCMLRKSRPQLFFFSFYIYVVTPPPDVPHCRRLWSTCKRLTTNHTHSHTHIQRSSLGRGTSADLLRNQPGAMIAETRQQNSCVVFLSRVHHCWWKGRACVHAHVFVFVCACWKTEKEISERRMFLEITGNVPSAHGRVYERHWTTAARNYCIVIKWQPY